MGRPPIGKRAMSAAERQRKLRTGSPTKPKVKAMAAEIRELKARIAELEVQLARAQAKLKARRDGG
jgi:hypothetical protein